MPNTSASGGPLLPLSGPSTPPLEDDALDDFMQALVVGVTGLAPTLVRPRWQPEPPVIPPVTTDWAAVGVVEHEPDTYAAEMHYCENEIPGPGHDLILRHEVLGTLCSFYGPHAFGYAGTLRDGMAVAQNREVLQLAAMGLVEVTAPVAAPELIKRRWLRRVDVTLRIRRAVARDYAVQNILTGDVRFNT